MSVHTNLLQNQRFINSTSTATVESLLGLVSCNPNIALLDFAKVVIRRDYKEMDEVKIISGGGSGHEPAFAGFVGKGLLTAAVQGEMYVSPSSSDIFRTILELTTENSLGVIAIIANNSGDRLNFGLAVERAQNLGIKARLLVITDDCSALPKPRDKRGLTGVCLVQKIASTLALGGKSVEEIYKFCDDLQREIYSISVSIKHCTSSIKGACYTCEFVLPKTELEIGAGLHGDPGKLQVPLTAVENACKIVFEQMTNEQNRHRLVFEPEVPVVVLINNLGMTTKMEEDIFTKEVLDYLKNINAKVLRLLIGRFVTSVNMYGFTLTIMKVKDLSVVSMLDEKCEATSWVQPLALDVTPDSYTLESKYKPSDTFELRGPRLGKRQANTLLLVTQFVCDALISCERQLNIIDAEIGDGDAGSRIKKGAEAINASLPSLNMSFPFTFLLSLGNIFEKMTAGTVGCLYGIMFEAAAQEFVRFPENRIVDGTVWLQALKRAVTALTTYTNSQEGEHTLLDPLSACATTMEECLNAKASDVDAFGFAVAAAEQVAQKTKVPPKKHPDPGAHAVAIWLRAAFEGVKLRCE